jgi:DNA-binding transcriptional LysR family regulator
MISVLLRDSQRMLVVASPAYFAEFGTPKSPADLLSHRCFRMRMASARVWAWEFERRGEVVSIDVQGPLTLDEASLMVDAALAGAGIAYLNEWNIAGHIEDGSLVTILEEWTPSVPGLCLYHPGRRHVPAGLRAMIELIRERRAP